jgi:RNA polymerase I-specific transcription initiation factor RRN11
MVDSFDPGLLNDAQTHFERARTLDPDNVIASAFLERLPSIVQGLSKSIQPPDDSDEDSVEVDDTDESRKRVRT